MAARRLSLAEGDAPTVLVEDRGIGNGGLILRKHRVFCAILVRLMGREGGLRVDFSKV